MNKSDLMDIALEKLGGDMDDLEGHSAMSHSAEDCPDPLGCKMHDGELGDNLSPAAVEGKPILEIEVKGEGLPSMNGAKAEEPSLDDKGENGEGLSEEDAEILKKLLK